MKARVKQLQTKRNALFRSADSIPQIEHDYAQLQRDHSVFKQNYDALLTRRETVLMSGEVESKTDSVEFRVIDPPRVPNKPAWPNRPMMVAAVPFGGIGLGLALAFLLTQLRPSIENRRQLLELTSFPLLGLVTMIETEAARRSKRRSNLLFTAGGVGLFLVLLAQMIYYLVLSPAA